MQPRLNTAVERVDLFDLHPMVAINLHCISTDAANIEKSVVVLKEETRGGTSVGT